MRIQKEQMLRNQAVETKEQLLQHLHHVQLWERSQRDLWWFEKVARLPFVWIDRLIPEVVHNKINEVLDELGHYIQSGGRYLVQPTSVYKRIGVHSGATIDKIPLSVMISSARYYRLSRRRYATVQGASLGFGGVLTLLLDLPALVGISLKVIQEIALSYGYDPHRREERLYVIKVLQFAATDLVGKQTILNELLQFDSPVQQQNMVAKFQGWREIVSSYRDNYSWKKLFKLIPLVGALFGAWVNRATLQEVAEAADMLYRKRRIMQRLVEMGKSSNG